MEKNTKFATVKNETNVTAGSLLLKVGDVLIMDKEYVIVSRVSASAASITYVEERVKTVETRFGDKSSFKMAQGVVRISTTVDKNVVIARLGSDWKSKNLADVVPGYAAFVESREKTKTENKKAKNMSTLPNKPKQTATDKAIDKAKAKEAAAAAKLAAKEAKANEKAAKIAAAVKAKEEKAAAKAAGKPAKTEGEANGPSTRGKLGQLFNFSVCAVIRAMGKKGYTVASATAALAKHGFTPAKATVSIQLGKGKTCPEDELAPLTPEQFASLGDAV